MLGPIKDFSRTNLGGTLLGPIRDLDLAARTVWGEARGEGFIGMLSVAWVLRNRLESPCWWCRGVKGIPDDTLSAVCLKPYQFSCWNKNDPNLEKMLKTDLKAGAGSLALRAVVNVLCGDSRDNTKGANHYHNVLVSPSWITGQVPLVTIGNHVFYKL